MTTSQNLYYTATCDCRVMINWSSANASAGPLLINSVTVGNSPVNGVHSGEHDMYLGAGETIYIQTNAQGTALVSVYEG